MTRSMKPLSRLGKITKWIKNLIPSFIERAYRFIFLRNKLSVSFNNSITLNNLISALPPLNSFYTLANDVSAFEVIKIDVKENLITIRETGTEAEYEIDPELFIILFIRVEADITPVDMDKYK